MLDCSRSTVLRLLMAGEFGEPSYVRRSVRVLLNEVLDYMNRSQRKPNGDGGEGEDN